MNIVDANIDGVQSVVINSKNTDLNYCRWDITKEGDSTVLHTFTTSGADGLLVNNNYYQTLSIDFSQFTILEGHTYVLTGYLPSAETIQYRGKIMAVNSVESYSTYDSNVEYKFY